MFKRLVIILMILGFVNVNVVFSSPNNTISIPNSFSPNTTIESSKVNSNNNEISSKYNAHNHTDITQLGTVTTGSWNATVIVPLYGGTGKDFSGASVGCVLAITSATGTVGKITPGTSGYFLRSNGSATLPTYVAGGSADNQVTRGFELAYATHGSATCGVTSGTLFHGSTYVNSTAKTNLTFTTAGDWINGTASSYVSGANWCYIGVSSAGAIKLLGNKAPDYADISGNTSGNKLYYKNTNGTTSYYRVIGAVKVNNGNKLAIATEQVGDWVNYSDASIPSIACVYTTSTTWVQASAQCAVPAFSNLVNAGIVATNTGRFYIKPTDMGAGKGIYVNGVNFANDTSGCIYNVRIDSNTRNFHVKTDSVGVKTVITGYYVGNIR